MSLNCPKCGASLDMKKNVNISLNMGHCEQCGWTGEIHEGLKKHVEKRDYDLNNPPNGIEIIKGGHSIQFLISTKSWLWLFLVPFMCAWSGFSMFSIGSLIIQDPKGNWFLFFFGLPFFLGSIVLLMVNIMLMFGQMSIDLERFEGVIKTGAFGLNWTRRFDWKNVRSVETVYSKGKHGTLKESALKFNVNGGKDRKFGYFLSDEKRGFLKFAMNELLVKK